MAEFRDQLRDRSGSLTDSAVRDPFRFVQLQQQQQGKQLDRTPDRGFSALATLLLAGIGGWALVRQFPSGSLKSLTKEVGDFFRNPRKFNISDSVLPKLHKAMDKISDVVARQPWAHVHKDDLGQFLGSARVAADDEVQRALRVLVETAEKNPKNFVHVMSVQRSGASKYLRPIPQDTSGLRSLTLGDLFDSKGGWREDVLGVMPENYQNIHRMVERFSRIRGMRGSSADILNRITVDPGVYVRRSEAGAMDLVNLRKLSPSQWIRHLGKRATVARAMPFKEQIKTGAIGARIGNWMAQMLVPTELFGTGPNVATVGAEAVRAAMPGVPRESIRGGIYLGGKLFPRYGGDALGQAVEGRFILGRSESAMGAAARIRAREVADREVVSMLKEMGISGHGLAHLQPTQIKRLLNIERERRGLVRGMNDLKYRSMSSDGIWMSPSAQRQYERLETQLKNVGTRKARMSSDLGAKMRTVGTATAPDMGPTGATARYLHEKDIQPWSLKGLAIRAGGRMGVGPQFAVGPRVDDDIATMAETGGEFFLKRAWKWATGPDPIGKMREAVSKTLGAAGQAAKQATRPNRPTYYVARRGEALLDWSNHLIGRVGRLLEETTGALTGVRMGMRPGLTPVEGMARWIGLGVAAGAGVGALQYIDYHMRNLTGTGPLTAPLQIYSAARVAQQAAFAGVGIQQGADYLENLMPGVIGSPLSSVVRAIGVTRMASGMPPFGGALGAGLARSVNLPGRFGRWGAVAATALGLTQFTDLGQSPANLAAVYRGEVDVPIREARWWSLGTQPYTGGRILHTRPHFIPTTLSRAGTIGRYGSEAERWRNSFLPTPESFFGLRPLLDPYRVERQNYFTRPYPLTAPMFDDVPFIGPALSATVGELIKPTQRWHGAYWRGGQLQEPGIPPQGPAHAAAALGYPQLSGLPRTPAGDPTRPLTVLGKQIDVIRDFLGMPGFLLGALKKQVTGEEDFFHGKREIATAGRITSLEREYYDLELGGMLGMTELVRRFIPHRRRQTELVNPIPNLMPSWLPGAFSAFPQDRPNRIDFHRGDPYAAVAQGESRLPGLGYEALHRLHSGIPGVYDAYDRWRILRDVAPTSQAFRHYDAIVRSWALGSRLSNQSGGKPLEAIFAGNRLRGVVKAAVDGDTIVVDVNGRLVNVRLHGGDAPEIAHSTFEASLPDSVAGNLAKRRLERHAVGRQVDVAVTGYNPGKYGGAPRLVGKVTTGGWGGRNVSEELEAAYPAYNLTAAQQQMVWNTRLDIERRFQPYPFTERIFNDPFRAVPRNMRDLTTRSLGDINQAIKDEGQYSLPEKLIGRVWESASHLSLPGPLNWPINKLFAQRDPLEVYRMQTQGAMEFGDWTTPVRSFIEPWATQTIAFASRPFEPFITAANQTTAALRGDVAGSYHSEAAFIPPRLQRQRVAEQGLDTVNFARYRMLEQRARDRQYPELATHYRQQQDRTVTGALISGNLRFIRGALPRSERGFFTAFRRERDTNRRAEILSLVPENVGAVLRHSWGEDVFQDRMDQAEMAHDLMHSMPRNWSGLHPDVPMTAMKVKVAHREGWDIHDFGFAHRDEYLAEDLFSGYTPIDQPEISFVPDIRPAAFNMAQQLRLQGVRVRAESHPGGPQIQMLLSRDQRRFYREYERYSSASAFGMKF